MLRAQCNERIGRHWVGTPKFWGMRPELRVGLEPTIVEVVGFLTLWLGCRAVSQTLGFTPGAG